MVTEATYDVYEHATGSKIHDNVDVQEAASAAYLDYNDVAWAVEEYGRCDSTLPDEGLGEGFVVIVPHGEPYPGQPGQGPWVIAEYDRDNALLKITGPFDKLDEAIGKVGQIADGRLATYPADEATIDACDNRPETKNQPRMTSNGAFEVPYFLIIVPQGSEGNPEDAWHMWEVRQLWK